MNNSQENSTVETTVNATTVNATTVNATTTKALNSKEKRELAKQAKIVADNIAQNKIVESAKEEESNTDKRENSVIIREKLRLYNTSTNEIFHNEKISHSKEVLDFVKNSTTLQKLNFMKNSMKVESIDLHVAFRLVANVLEFYNELKNESNEENLKTVLFSYNVKKIVSVTDSKKVILEYFEKFVKYDDAKKTFRVENIEEFLTNYAKSKEYVKKSRHFFKLKTFIKDFVTYSRSCSLFYSANKDSLSLYNVLQTNNTYNIVRNINCMTEIKQLLIESIKDESERKYFESETCFYFSNEIAKQNYNCNSSTERKEFHSLYSMQFEIFKNSENFSSEIEKLSKMTYFEQVSYYVEKHLHIEKFEDVIFYINKNYKKILMTAE